MLSAVALVVAGCGGGGDDANATQAAAASSGGSGSSQATLGSQGSTPMTSDTPAPTSTTDDDGNPFTNPSSDTSSGASSPIAKQDCGIANLGRDLLALINAERARGASCGSRGIYAPAGPLAWNTQLEDAAIGHSTDMSGNNFFSHVGSSGGTLAVRVDATGYQWMLLGENIAASFDTPEATVAAWMASDGHCVNMMNANFSDVALACVHGSAETMYRNYWTLDFGSPR